MPREEGCIQAHCTGGGGSRWHLPSTPQNPWLKVPQLCEFRVNTVMLIELSVIIEFLKPRLQSLPLLNSEVKK